jgi:hypothetical protein
VLRPEPELDKGSRAPDDLHREGKLATSNRQGWRTSQKTASCGILEGLGLCECGDERLEKWTRVSNRGVVNDSDEYSWHREAGNFRVWHLTRLNDQVLFPIPSMSYTMVLACASRSNSSLVRPFTCVMIKYLLYLSRPVNTPMSALNQALS